MKKLLIGILASAFLVTVNAQNVVSTNVAGAGNFVLLNTGVKIKNVILSSANAGLVKFYDADTVSGYTTNGGTLTNITQGYVSRSGYATNTIVSAPIGLSGYTNHYTNSGWFSYNVTNAQATNVLNPVAAFAISAGTMGSYPTDINTKFGLLFSTTTNANIVIYYENQ